MTQKSEQLLLKELIDGLTQASGAASILIHMQQNPRFIPLREALNLAKEGVIHKASMQVEKMAKAVLSCRK